MEELLPAQPGNDQEPPHPWLGKKVAFRYDHCDWGTGKLIYATEVTGVAKVVDDFDGQVWFGLLDHVELETGEGDD